MSLVFFWALIVGSKHSVTEHTIEQRPMAAHRGRPRGGRRQSRSVIVHVAIVQSILQSQKSSLLTWQIETTDGRVITGLPIEET